MSTVPAEQKALLLDAHQGTYSVKNAKVYKPGPGQVLVKIKATALNPIDWKNRNYAVFITQYPAVLGTDAAGDVAAVGEGVTKFKVGDKVFCQGQYVNEFSTFQEFTLADEQHLAKIPSNLSYDQVSTLPLAIATAFIGLYNSPSSGAGIASPLETANQGKYKGEPFVVLGGASSVGQYVIQLAKLSGFSPIFATASVKHTDYLKSLGATHVLDRKLSNAELKAKIAEITGNKPIKYVYDSIAGAETQKTGNELLASGGTLILVLGPQVQPTDKTVVYISSKRETEPNSELVKGLYAKLTEWLETGIIKPNKVELVSGGLAAIPDGLKKLESDQVSGVKLVVRPEESS